jgi:hypothetical protein
MDSNTILGFAVFGITLLIGLPILFIGMTYPSQTFKALSYPFKLLALLFINIFKLCGKLFVNNERLVGKDNCAIIPGTEGDVTKVPSAYLANVAFFFAFLFTNAYYVYITHDGANSSSTQYENRRYRSAMIMATIITLYLIIVFTRYNITGCDSPLGILYTTLAFGALGFGTYKLAEMCGARAVDILGISSSFIPNSAENDAPLVCGR